MVQLLSQPPKKGPLFAVEQPPVIPEEQVRGELLVAVNVLNGQSEPRARILGTSDMRDVLEGRPADEVGRLMDQDGHSLERPEI